MNRTRVAVVGCGHLGSIHARLLRSIDEVELVGVVDPVLAARERVAAECGTAALVDVVPLLGTLDAAIIATPTAYHHEVAEQLLSAGTHLLIEKPITNTVAEANRLIALARQQGLVLQVGHVERFNPAWNAVLPHLHHPQYIEAVRRRNLQFPFDRCQYRAGSDDPRSGSGHVPGKQSRCGCRSDGNGPLRSTRRSGDGPPPFRERMRRESQSVAGQLRAAADDAGVQSASVRGNRFRQGRSALGSPFAGGAAGRGRPDAVSGGAASGRAGSHVSRSASHGDGAGREMQCDSAGTTRIRRRHPGWWNGSRDR